MNIVSLLGGMLIVLTPNTMKIIVKVIVNILYRLNIFKSLNKKIHTINKFIDEYSYSIKLFIKNKKALCLSIILTIIQLTVFFSISYCVYKAFNLNGLSLLKFYHFKCFYTCQFLLSQHLEMLVQMKLHFLPYLPMYFREI